MFLVGLLFGFNFSNSYGTIVRNYSVKSVAACMSALSLQLTLLENKGI